MADTTQITPSELSVVTTIADADKIMVTHSNGTTEVIQGSKLKDFIKTIDNANALSALDTTKTNPVNSSAVNSALSNYQPIVTNVIAGNSEWDTGIFLNKSVQNTNNYKYKKTHLLMLSAINGYGDTVSSRLVLLSIGRSGNYVTATTVSEKSSSVSITWLNNMQFAPSNEETSPNDNNTLIIKNNNTNVNYQVEVRFL